jgi:OOP family OmpA-OmpF porin
MQQALSMIAPTRRTASGMVIELANDSFYFDFDKSTLRPENREILSRIAGVLLASEGYRLFVYGHTDDTGPDEYNQQLSLRRAVSVADYLKRAGVPDEVMRVQGFGKSSPRVQNDSPPARQKNRRVEIGIVDSIIEYKGLAPNA